MNNWRVILHVEDDERWAQTIKRLLEHTENKQKILGDSATTLMLVQAQSFDSAKEAYIEYVLEGKIPELVILDIDLEGGTHIDLNGVEFAKRLADMKLTRKTSIILLSGNMNMTIVKDELESVNLPVFARFDKVTFRDHLDDFIEAVVQCMQKNYKFDDMLY